MEIASWLGVVENEALAGSSQRCQMDYQECDVPNPYKDNFTIDMSFLFDDIKKFQENIVISKSIALEWCKIYKNNFGLSSSDLCWLKNLKHRAVVVNDAEMED